MDGGAAVDFPASSLLGGQVNVANNATGIGVAIDQYEPEGGEGDGVIDKVVVAKTKSKVDTWEGRAIVFLDRSSVRVLPVDGSRGLTISVGDVVNLKTSRPMLTV